MDVRLHEVSLRDGLQNEAAVLPIEVKLELAERLVAAGFRDIEAGSFVSPRRLPQMADTAELFARLPRAEGVRWWALVPNRIGLERALDAGVQHVATVLSASETHNQRNVNRSVRESLAALTKAIGTAKAEGLGVRSYVSTVYGCPYEGEVDPSQPIRLAAALLEAGADEIALGDTTGVAHPEQVRSIVAALVAEGVPIERIACHFHDTRGMAVVNAYAAWQAGVRVFDGSIAGIGGCPYAPGATGNAATEDLVNLFQQIGCATGVDLDLACAAGEFMEGALGRELTGRYQRYWQATRGRMEKASRSA